MYLDKDKRRLKLAGRNTSRGIRVTGHHELNGARRSHLGRSFFVIVFFSYEKTLLYSVLSGKKQN